MWWKPEPGSFDEAEARAAWVMVVEARTTIAHVHKDLDRLHATAAEVGPWVASRWPTFAEEISAIIDGLRADPDSPQHRIQLEIIADEMEEQLRTGLGWPRDPAPPN